MTAGPAAGFSADTTSLAQHAARFSGLADRAEQIHTELCRALAAVGDCWGDDEAGRGFADGHVQPAADTLSRLGTLSDRLADTGGRFGTMATAYQRADQDSARALRADR